MARLTLDERALHIKREARPKPVSLRLQTLRLVSLFIPGSYDWNHAQEAAHYRLIDLDSLNSVEYAALVEELAAVPEEDSAEVRLFLEDYTGRHVTLTLQEIRASDIDLLEEIRDHRRERRDRLARWMRNVPDLIVTGIEGDMAIFDLDGIRTGSDRFLPWSEFGEIEAREGATEDSRVYRLRPRSGRGEGHVVRMPRRKAHLFLAECVFWRALGNESAEEVA